MSNPLNSGFQNNFAVNPQIKNMANMLKLSQNPNQMMQSLMQSNPQMAQVMQLVQGKNPQEVFYAMCKEKGIDPNSILNQLK